MLLQSNTTVLINLIRPAVNYPQTRTSSPYNTFSLSVKWSAPFILIFLFYSSFSDVCSPCWFMCLIFQNSAAINVCSAESVVFFFPLQRSHCALWKTRWKQKLLLRAIKRYHFRPISVKLLNELQFAKSFKPHLLLLFKKIKSAWWFFFLVWAHFSPCWIDPTLSPVSLMTFPPQKRSNCQTERGCFYHGHIDADL